MNDRPISGDITPHLEFALDAMSKADIPTMVICVGDAGLQLDMNVKPEMARRMLYFAAKTLDPDFFNEYKIK